MSHKRLFFIFLRKETPQNLAGVDFIY